MIGILSKRSQNRGFTLLEVVISMGLITIALLAVFRLQAQNLDLQSEAQFITLANHLAQDRMSQIQAGDELTEGSSSGDFLDKKDATKDLSIETYLYRNQM
jgi:prepilin-type N-terminal cleavage/methylation domain-containing protein